MPDLSFQFELNFWRIAQMKLRAILGYLFFAVLFVFGLYGVWALCLGYLSIFYFSLLTDMFLFYLWNRKKEKIRKIVLSSPGQKIDVISFLDNSAQQSLFRAWLLCYWKRYPSLRPIHLFASFLKDPAFKKILKRLDCQPKQVIEKTKNIFKSASFFPERETDIRILGPKIASDFKKIFYGAYLFCLAQGKEQISSLDILWSISQQKNLVGMIFDEFGISLEEIEQVIEWFYREQEIIKWEKSFFWRRLLKPKGKLNRAMTAALTPFLDNVSRDMTFLARQGRFEMTIGREKEIEEIFRFFSAGQPGVVLVGKSEIGKKAVIKKIAQMMVEENVPKFLRDKRLVELDLANLASLSGAGERGEEYLRRIFFEVNRAGNIILVIEDVDNMVGLKSQGSSLGFADILASALKDKAFFFISTSLPEEFSSKIEGKVLGRVLNKVTIALPTRDRILQILISKIYIIEKELKVLFSVDAFSQAVDLADRYIYGKALPAKAIDLLSETAYAVRAREKTGALIKEKDVIDLVSQKTKIPLGRLKEMEKKKLLQLEKFLHQRVINQDEAVEAVASALRRSRLETKAGKRPICNFLFIGATGVGKTELAKTLAQVYFGNEKRMIRLDMSEYQEKRSLRQIIGLRSDTGISKGFLTEAVKRQPYSLLLLDELEKAHPDIVNLFLQVMEDGRLTDVSGETINFANIILIATSNAATQFIQEKIRQKKDYKEIEKELKDKVLLEYFKPELLNRFDKVVLFKALSFDNVVKIAYLFLEKVREKLEEKGIGLEIEQEAVEELAQAGFDPLYGARPLRRVIQDRVENKAAQLFLEDKVKRRDKLILKKGLEFEIKKAPEI